MSNRPADLPDLDAPDIIDRVVRPSQAAWSWLRKRIEGPLPGPRVFENELGGNPRVYDTGHGYRMAFRYSDAYTRELINRGIGLGSAAIGALAVWWLVQHVSTNMIYQLMGAAAGAGVGLMVAQPRRDIPFNSHSLYMDFGPSAVAWWRGARGTVHTLPCTPDNRPVAQVQVDRVAEQRARRAAQKPGGVPLLEEILQVVFTSGPHPINFHAVVTIRAVDAGEQAVRLVSTINMLIAATAQKEWERGHDA